MDDLVENWQSATISALESSNTFWSSLNFYYTFVGHALFCTLPGSEFKDRWLVHLLVSVSQPPKRSLDSTYYVRGLTICFMRCS
jgi:hypothetical protein